MNHTIVLRKEELSGISSMLHAYTLKISKYNDEWCPGKGAYLLFLNINEYLSKIEGESEGSVHQIVVCHDEIEMIFKATEWYVYNIPLRYNHPYRDIFKILNNYMVNLERGLV